jgi:hypothetical protein
LGRYGLVITRHTVVVVAGGRRAGQAIKRTRTPVQGRLLCPKCGRPARTLYAPPHGQPPEFRCAACWGGVAYAAWRTPGQYREPKGGAAWWRWLQRQLRKLGIEPLPAWRWAQVTLEEFVRTLWRLSRESDTFDQFYHLLADRAVAAVQEMERRAQEGDPAARKMVEAIARLAANLGYPVEAPGDE